MKYILYCVGNDNVAYERKSSNSLKDLKVWVAEERNENGLHCAMYISNNTRIVKRYKEIPFEAL